MRLSTRQQIIATSRGTLAVEESGQGGIPVLLIHGNSFCRGVFRNQMQGQIGKNHRMIAFDLPAHGQSSNAADPKRSYTRPGLADAAVELLDKLGVNESVDIYVRQLNTFSVNRRRHSSGICPPSDQPTTTASS